MERVPYCLTDRRLCQVCENVAVEEWSVYRPYPEEMGPYATKGKQWVGYDDEFIVRKKVSHSRQSFVLSYVKDERFKTEPQLSPWQTLFIQGLS